MDYIYFILFLLNYIYIYIYIYIFYNMDNYCIYNIYATFHQIIIIFLLKSLPYI